MTKTQYIDANHRPKFRTTVKFINSNLKEYTCI